MHQGADDHNFVTLVSLAVKEPADSEALGEERCNKGARRQLLGLDLLIGGEVLHGVAEVQTSVGATASACRFLL